MFVFDVSSSFTLDAFCKLLTFIATLLLFSSIFLEIAVVVVLVVFIDISLILSFLFGLFGCCPRAIFS